VPKTEREARELARQLRAQADELDGGGEDRHRLIESARALGGGSTPSRNPKVKLREVLEPLRKYLKNWDEDRLYGVTPKDAKRLLKVVQEIDHTLLEVERALEERTIVSRALR